MASRALGASLALATAAAFVVSIASSAWWSGHPVVEGKEITAKHVFAGPLGATGCNTGGDGSCEAIALASDIRLVGYGTLAATALATIFAVILLFAASRISERRKGIALASLAFTLIAAGAGVAFLALGPGLQTSQHVEVPIGWGTFVFGGGVVTSLLATIVARSLEPEPLRLKSPDAPAHRESAPPAPTTPPTQAPLHAPLALAATVPAQALATVPPSPAMAAPPPAVVASPAPPAPHRAAVMTAQTEAAALLVTQRASAPPPAAPPPRPAIAPTTPPAPSASGAPPLPGIAPASASSSRVKAASVPPPLRPPSPSEVPPRSRTPSAAGSDVFAVMPLASDAGSSAKNGSDNGPARPFALGSDSLRPKSPSSAPLTDALRPKSPSNVPPPPRDPLRPKPTTSSPLDKRPIVPPPAVGTKPAPPARGTAGVSPPTAKPLPGLTRPSPPRVPTQHATPPPAAATGTDAATANRPQAGRSANAASPPRSPTLATAVPPPPVETDDKPSTAAVALPTTPPKPRADTDARTGKNRIVDATEPNLPAAPPRASTEVEAVDAVRETTAQTLMAPEPPPPRDPEDLLKTFEANPKSFDRSAKEPSAAGASASPQAPIPTLERTAGPGERAVQVPISTAPSTLPPPKQLDAEPSGPSPACPQCEAPMSWVEEHLRFYCRQCRMYF